jgi:hypothetical protein
LGAKVKMRDANIPCQYGERGGKAYREDLERAFEGVEGGQRRSVHETGRYHKRYLDHTSVAPDGFVHDSLAHAVVAQQYDDAHKDTHHTGEDMLDETAFGAQKLVEAVDKKGRVDCYGIALRIKKKVQQG